MYEGENRTTKVRGLRERSSHRFRIRASRVRASTVFAGAWSRPVAFDTSKQPPAGLRNAPTVNELSAGFYQVEWPPFKSLSPRGSLDDAATSGEETSVGGSSQQKIIYKLQVRFDTSSSCSLMTFR